MYWKISAVAILLFLAKLICSGHSRSTGAPAEACSTLIPQHGANTNSTNPVPYSCTLEVRQYIIPDFYKTHRELLKLGLLLNEI